MPALEERKRPSVPLPPVSLAQLHLFISSFIFSSCHHLVSRGHRSTSGCTCWETLPRYPQTHWNLKNTFCSLACTCNACFIINFKSCHNPDKGPSSFFLFFSFFFFFFPPSDNISCKGQWTILRRCLLGWGSHQELCASVWPGEASQDLSIYCIHSPLSFLFLLLFVLFCFVFLWLKKEKEGYCQVLSRRDTMFADRRNTTANISTPSL